MLTVRQVVTPIQAISLVTSIFSCYTQPDENENEPCFSTRRRRNRASWMRLFIRREWQKQQKGESMKRTWTSEELLEHFTLLPGELAAVGHKSGPTRLGFAVLLKCLQYEGRFPRSRQEVAPRWCAFSPLRLGWMLPSLPSISGRGAPSKPTGRRSGR